MTEEKQRTVEPMNEEQKQLGERLMAMENIKEQAQNSIKSNEITTEINNVILEYANKHLKAIKPNFDELEAKRKAREENNNAKNK